MNTQILNSRYLMFRVQHNINVHHVINYKTHFKHSKNLPIALKYSLEHGYYVGEYGKQPAENKNTKLDLEI